MTEPRDSIDLRGVRITSEGGADAERQPKPWLGIHFKCCHVYGRIHRNAEGNAYVGRCPGCGAPLRVPIGPSGSSRRIFEAE